MTLTIDEATQHVQRLSYMPGWSFRLTYDPDTLDIRLHVTALVDDSTTHEPRKIKVGSVHWGSQMILESTDVLERWVSRGLQSMLAHEHDEWFKRDGKPINNPHHRLERIP